MNNQATIEEKKELLKYYYGELHYGQDKCSKLLGPGIGRTTIKQWLKELGLPIRTFAEGKQYSNTHRRYKNEKYFQTESHNMAWLLGFLASDGTVDSKRNRIKIGLARKDEEILEKIRQEVQIENQLSYYTTNKGYDVVELVWVCAQHKDDLENYSIVPKKSLILKPPYNLSEKYWMDYIRGYFDGDGSISRSSDGNIRFQIGGASREIIEWIVEVLSKNCSIHKANISVDNRHKHLYYYFQYCTKASKEIYKKLYVSDSLYLQRKYDKFSSIIKEKEKE